MGLPFLVHTEVVRTISPIVCGLVMMALWMLIMVLVHSTDLLTAACGGLGAGIGMAFIQYLAIRSAKPNS